MNHYQMFHFINESGQRFNVNTSAGVWAIIFVQSSRKREEHFSRLILLYLEHTHTHEPFIEYTTHTDNVFELTYSLVS